MQFWVPASMEDIFEAGGYKLKKALILRLAGWRELARRNKKFPRSPAASKPTTRSPTAGRGARNSLAAVADAVQQRAHLAPTLEIMLVVLPLVLIACANVGNLLLVRLPRVATKYRWAIGAGRVRLLKQLLTEGLLLSVSWRRWRTSYGPLVPPRTRTALPPRGGVSMYLPGELDWRVLASVQEFASLLRSSSASSPRFRAVTSISPAR